MVNLLLENRGVGSGAAEWRSGEAIDWAEELMGGGTGGARSGGGTDGRWEEAWGGGWPTRGAGRRSGGRKRRQTGESTDQAEVPAFSKSREPDRFTGEPMKS